MMLRGCMGVWPLFFFIGELGFDEARREKAISVVLDDWERGFCRMVDFGSARCFVLDIEEYGE